MIQDHRERCPRSLIPWTDTFRTKIPEPPIHFSGVTNFFGPKNEFTIHQFETSVLETPMSFNPLSNHQTVVKTLVTRKFIFRSKKIGDSRKVNWWFRNFILLSAWSGESSGELENLGETW
jgi:hypothetical protein